MTLSAPAYYYRALWDFSIGYRLILWFWRMAELWFISMRFLLIRAPILIVWTRLPVLRTSRFPYDPINNLIYVFEAGKTPRLLVIGSGDRLGFRPFDHLDSVDKVAGTKDRLTEEAQGRRSTAKELVGSIIRGLLTEVGPAFIKLGQIMSMRPEIPPFLREQLTLLQDRQPTLSPEQVRICLERELHRPVDTVFEWVDYDAVASASLAVVHHAKLRNGEEVALKIQRPYLEGILKLDLALITGAIGVAKALLPGLRNTDLRIFTTSFGTRTLREIDFENESIIQERFRVHLASHPVYKDLFKIARVYREYTTTKLLTMEFVKGFVRVDRIFDEFTDEQIVDFVTWKPDWVPDVPLAVITMAGSFMGYTLCEMDTYHGDLHGGNLYIIPPTEPGTHDWKVFLCDYGMYEEIDRGSPTHRASVELFLGLFSGNVDRTIRGLVALSFATGSMTAERFERYKIYQMLDEISDIFTIVLRKYSMEVEGGSTAFGSAMAPGQNMVGQELVNVIFESAVVRGLSVPPDFWLIAKSMLYLEQLAGVIATGVTYSGLFEPYDIRYRKDETLEYVRRSNVFNFPQRIPDMIDCFDAPMHRDAVGEALLQIARLSEEK